MKSIVKGLMAIVLLLSVTIANAQSPKTVTDTVKINGNCSMCKKTIETAANSKSAKLNWDENTKTATLTYNPKKTSVDEVLKRVADAGYDNEKFRSADAVYDKLHGCCKYDREVIEESDAQQKDEPTSPVKKTN